MLFKSLKLFAAAWLAACATGAVAQSVKVGVVLPYTGVGAEFGQQVDRGMQMFMKLNPKAFEPYQVQIVKRDSKNPSGAEARVAVQELVAQEKVDILTGFIYSPDAIASAALFTEAKRPAVIMNAGTAWITNLSPMISRVSFSMWHAGHAMGVAAAKNLKAKTAVVGYSDFPPGKDSLDAFKSGFESNGGKVIDAIPMGGPGQVPDFTPFFQRVKDQKPDCFYVFIPSGAHATGVVKTYGEVGLRAAGVKLIGPMDVIPDNKLQDMGDAAIGTIVMGNYAADLDHAANKAFLKAWYETYPANTSPDFMSAAGYDTMAAIFHVIKTLDGKLDDGEKIVATLKGWKHNGPRGDIMIDPVTRDIIQDERAEEVIRKPDGKLGVKILGVVPQVKDQCKELKLGRCGQAMN